tara:strand:- start:455 stop:781 length:327 start_codon:yes stop_codon:yes gene_type:complete
MNDKQMQNAFMSVRFETACLDKSLQKSGRSLSDDSVWEEVFKSAEECGKLFYQFAGVIVEPSFENEDEEAMSAYSDFVENNSNWPNWISSVLDSNWKKVAELVRENGY